MKLDFKIIAVDFDGTLCKEEWPNIGKPNESVINYIKEQRAEGAKVILWTCREGELLDAAIRWCKEQGLEFDAINDNIPEAAEVFGGNSRKIYADEYIDDKAAGNRFIIAQKLFKQPTPYKHFLFIEDGSVDVYDLVEHLNSVNQNVLPIVYRQGALRPELVEVF